MNKEVFLWLVFIIAFPKIVMAYELSAYTNQATIALSMNETKGLGKGVCSPSLQNCLVRVTQYPGCQLPPGYVTITNNSKIPAKGIQATSANSNFNNLVVKTNKCAPLLAPGASCRISFYTNSAVQFLASNISVKGTNTNAVFFDLQAIQCVTSATLTPSVSTLGLSVKCPVTSMSPDCAQKNAALTGAPRTITIKNTGSVAATNVLVSSSGLPSDALVSPLRCDTIAVGGECVITVTAGATASSNASGALCTTGVQPAGRVSVTANGGLSTSVDTYMLSYGCIYQGGFLYSVDDTTPTMGSIGGKTAAIMDTYPGQILLSSEAPNWGGDGTDIGFALYDTNAQGANDGSANSAAIISALTTNYSSPPYSGSSPVLLSDYAAGLCSSLSVGAAGASSCTAPNTCYTNWYLPAICELGPFSLGASCTTTNIQQQLFENTLIPGATLGLVDAGYYSSSTEEWNGSPTIVWSQYFSLGVSNQLVSYKTTRLGVRCSRALIF